MPTQTPPKHRAETSRARRLVATGGSARAEAIVQAVGGTAAASVVGEIGDIVSIAGLPGLVLP
jgi:hypothetical protein